LDRAALDLDAAMIHGDFQAQIGARQELARADPADPNHHRALAETLMGMRDYSDAIVEFRRGLALRPDDILALNAMGYAAAFAGDLPTAIRVLRGYEQLRPKEPNPLDSLGDAHFALGHFGEAEQFYLAAHARSPAFLNGGELLKGAQARLMTGDVPGATALFHRYSDERQAAHDPNAPYQAAAWFWATGQRHAAIESMDRLTGGDARGEAHAGAQVALWLLELGDRPRAAEHARKAVAEAAAANSGVAALVAYLVQPSELPAPAQPQLQQYAQAYALLFARQFQPAADALQRIYAQPTGELDDGLSVLLAWAYVETGQWQKAEPLLRLTPLPQAAGLPIFSSLYFPRLFWLRGRVLEHEGHGAQAAGYFKLFRTLAGPDRTIWDNDNAGSVTRP
jgi:tetratricopeptide (TPR) repeat protein